MKHIWVLFLGTVLFNLNHAMAGPLPILLTIDDSNPSAVTITATGLNAATDDSSISGRLGVELLNFFSQDQYNLYNAFPANPSLFGSGQTLSYNSIASDNYSTGGGEGSYLDFGLYVNDESPAANNLQTFSTTQPAFSGTWTIDLSSFGVSSSALPAFGTRGDIMPGFSGEHGTTIGQWQVAAVPEPSTGSLLILGSAAGLMFWRHRSRKNAVSRV